MKAKRMALVITALLLALLLCACTINPNMTPAQESPTEDSNAPAEAETPTAEEPADADTATEPEEPAEPEEPEEPEVTGLAFPYVLEDGTLTVESLFTSDITNPDKDDELVSGLASLQVTNSGDAYVERADITVTTLDGQELHFVVTNLPAGKSLLAFDVDSTVLAEGKVDAITAECSLAGDAEIPDGLTVLVGDSGITVKNEMDVDLADVTVIYHCLMGDSYFGGISYSQTIEVLPHGSREVLSADECLLGTPEVVCVTIG